MAELTQTLLRQAFGGRVDRREGLLDRRRRLVAVERPIFGMVDLQARGAGAGLTVTAQVGAAFEALLLRIAEMIEAQAQHAGAVAQAHDQTAALAHGHIGAADHTFDHRVLARTQCADGHHAGAVLITQGQMEQQILQVL